MSQMENKRKSRKNRNKNCSMFPRTSFLFIGSLLIGVLCFVFCLGDTEYCLEKEIKLWSCGDWDDSPQQVCMLNGVYKLLNQSFSKFQLQFFCVRPLNGSSSSVCHHHHHVCSHTNEPVDLSQFTQARFESYRASMINTKRRCLEDPNQNGDCCDTGCDDEDDCLDQYCPSGCDGIEWV